MPRIHLLLFVHQKWLVFLKIVLAKNYRLLSSEVPEGTRVSESFYFTLCISVCLGEGDETLIKRDKFCLTFLQSTRKWLLQVFGQKWKDMSTIMQKEKKEKVSEVSGHIWQKSFKLPLLAFENYLLYRAMSSIAHRAMEIMIGSVQAFSLLQ